MAVPHLPFDFRPGYQGRYRVDDDNINGTAANKRVTDFQSLFSVIRLGNQQVINIHAQTAGIIRIQGMLRVDKSRIASHLLGFRDHMQRYCRFAGRFRPVDFHNTPPGDAADT